MTAVFDSAVVVALVQRLILLCCVQGSLTSYRVDVGSTDTVSPLPSLYVDDSLPSDSAHQSSHTSQATSVALFVSAAPGQRVFLGESSTLSFASVHRTELSMFSGVRSSAAWTLDITITSLGTEVALVASGAVVVGCCSLTALFSLRQQLPYLQRRQQQLVHELLQQHVPGQSLGGVRGGVSGRLLRGEQRQHLHGYGYPLQSTAVRCASDLSPCCVTACDSSCATCTGPNSNQCVTCPANRFQNGNECPAICPIGFFGRSGDNVCVTNCPSGTFKRNTDRTCAGEQNCGSCACPLT